jgi:hypothetical protein
MLDIDKKSKKLSIGEPSFKSIIVNMIIKTI